MAGMAVSHYFWQRWLDRRQGITPEPIPHAPARPQAPLGYALLPTLPLLGVFLLDGQYGVRLDINAIILLCLLLAALSEFARKRDARKLFDGLIDTRLGRQDFVYGTGKILADGTPLDGSRTFFADGAKVTFKFEGHSLDLLGLYTAQQPQPVINNQDTNLIETDQWAAGLYGKYNRFEQVPFEYYWIYKHEDDTATSYKVAGKYVLADANFSTFGFRVMPKFGYGLTGNLEVATQVGDQGEDDVNGTMVDSSLSFAPPGFLPDFKPLLKVGYWYLSGNEPDSTSNEGWHPVYGRQPQDNWGELLGYTLIGSQYSVFGWSNFSTPFVTLEASPLQKTRLILRYSWVGAEQDDGLGGGDGTNRGGLFFALFTFDINPQLKGHLWGEWFDPGNYYADTARGDSFLRLNLEYSF